MLHPRAMLLSRVLRRWASPEGVLKVAVSNTVAGDYERVFGWRNVSSVPCGISLKGLDPSIDPAKARELRRGLGVPEGAFLVTMPAGFRPVKGNDVLLQALARLGPEFFVLAAGQGPSRRSLEQLAKRLGVADRVRFHDPVPQSVLFDWMRMSDAVTLPSRREAFGLAAAEAMALGRPVVLSRIEGFVELIGESNGALWAEPDDPGSLADALSRLQGDATLRQDLGRRGSERVRASFSIEACADRWASLFRRAVIDAAGRPGVL